MCMADTNIKQIDPDAGGVAVWGVERRCGDYDDVRHWAMTWRSKTVKASDHHHHDQVELAFCRFFCFIFELQIMRIGP